MKKNISQIKLGAIVAYFAIAFNIVSGLLYTPWMIEEIGQSDYGLFTLANSLISLFLLDFGLSSATSRYVAKYRAEGKIDELNKFLNIIYKLYLIIDAIIMVILIVVFFCSDIIYKNLSAEELHKFKVVYCIAGLYSVISFPCVTFKGILDAYEQFLPVKIADLIHKVLTVAFTVIALSCGQGLYALVTISAVCGLLTIFIKLYYVNKSVKIKRVKIVKEDQKQIFNEILKFSIWSTVSSLAQRLIFNITPTLIGMVIAQAAAAISVFGIVTTIEGYFYTITTAINGMFLSRITRITMDDNDGKQLTYLATKVGRFQFALNGLMILGFTLIGKQFITLWVGNDFIDAYYGIVLVVLPGLFFNSLQIINTAFIVQNLVKYQAMIQLIMGVCNVIMSLIFTKWFGVIGACASICIAYFVRVVLTFILVKKRMKFDFAFFFKSCYLKMGIPLILAGVLSYLIFMKISVNTWIELAVGAGIISVIYLICVWFVGLNGKERKYFISGISKKLNKR